ncbi:hypothetical protein Q3G72_023001 [Acer saccharum]|nr:hypothetical protein Q3G72_023001 [Acer saccharum]
MVVAIAHWWPMVLATTRVGGWSRSDPPFSRTRSSILMELLLFSSNNPPPVTSNPASLEKDQSSTKQEAHISSNIGGGSVHLRRR